MNELTKRAQLGARGTLSGTHVLTKSVSICFGALFVPVGGVCFARKKFLFHRQISAEVFGILFILLTFGISGFLLPRSFADRVLEYFAISLVTAVKLTTISSSS